LSCGRSSSPIREKPQWHQPVDEPVIIKQMGGKIEKLSRRNPSPFLDYRKSCAAGSCIMPASCSENPAAGRCDLKPSRRTILKAVAALSVLAAGTAHAQQFPSKPIRLIVPASPGTSIDAITRFFSDPLSKSLKVPVVVENRSGAGGLMAYREAAGAAPDGYTLILTGIPLYLLPLFSTSNVPTFDPVKDFTPIARVARVPFAIVVASDAPYRSLPELIEAMRRKPKASTYSSQGVGSSAHLCAVTLNANSQTEALHVSYKESSMATTDVAGGRITFTCQTSTGVLPLISAGKLKPLAVTGSQRWGVLPDVPTAVEAGVTEFEFSSQLDFMAPPGLSQGIATLLSQHLVRIARGPEFQQFCIEQILALEVRDREDLAPEIAKEVAKWQSTARLAQAR
jgi:tripartite-type tricarboxylate transporter receptor subunit TctC